MRDWLTLLGTGLLGALGRVNRALTRDVERARSEADREIDPKSKARGHEVRDANARGLAIAAVAFALAGVALHAAVFGIFSSLRATLRHDTAGPADQALLAWREGPPPPRLQTDPAADFAHYRLARQSELSTYGWVDRKAGIARVPIERAMELLSHGK